MLRVLGLLLLVGAAACSGAVACPAIDLANRQLCPVVAVRMPDGSVEAIPAGRLRLIRIEETDPNGSSDGGSHDIHSTDLGRDR